MQFNKADLENIPIESVKLSDIVISPRRDALAFNMIFKQAAENRDIPQLSFSPKREKSITQRLTEADERKNLIISQKICKIKEAEIAAHERIINMIEVRVREMEQKLREKFARSQRVLFEKRQKEMERFKMKSEHDLIVKERFQQMILQKMENAEKKTKDQMAKSEMLRDNYHNNISARLATYHAHLEEVSNEFKHRIDKNFDAVDNSIYLADDFAETELSEDHLENMIQKGRDKISEKLQKHLDLESDSEKQQN